MPLVNPKYFTEVRDRGIPKMIWGSHEWRSWWKEQKKRCIYGITIGGRYMPGKLYWHTNFFHIELNDELSPRRKTIGLPELTDLEWEVFSMYEEAKNEPNPYRTDGNGMDYYRSNIKLIGENNLFRPLEDGTKGVCIVGSRDSGKSFDAASIASHEYTFFKNNEILVTASDARYSKKLMSKVRVGLDSLKGEITMGYGKDATTKPPFFAHGRIKKDFYSELRSGYYKEGSDIPSGYNSVMYHIIYGINDMAANGFRPSYHIFEEAGAWDGGADLIDCFNSSVSCWESNAIWTAVPWIQGTGGNMQKGTTSLHKMFYNPNSFNLLAFEDTWEGKGKICYFIPANKSVRQYKDEYGNTIEPVATNHFMKIRAEKEKSADKKVLTKHIMYRPLKPSEAFLKSGSGVFPTRLLSEHLATIENTQFIKDIERRGRISIVKGKMEWKEDMDLIPADYPTKENEKEGCICIYELPDDNAPDGTYVAGTDPYDQDDSTTNSLGSTTIYKRFKVGLNTYKFPVAEYTGRPENSNLYYEGVRRLMKLYNARNMYENQLIGFRNYISSKGDYHMLAEQPDEFINAVLKETTVARKTGCHMTTDIRKGLEEYTRNWLLEEYAPGQYNLTKIYSVPLLKELIAYETDKNFDRVDGFMLALMYDAELTGIFRGSDAEEQEEQVEEEVNFWDIDPYSRN